MPGPTMTTDKPMNFFSDRTRVAQLVFGLDAALGVLGIGAASLYGAALSSGNPWTVFLAIFLSCSGLWLLFCFCAYKGLTSDNLLLKGVFWLAVVGHLPAFPVGTAFSGASIWLWRELRRQAPTAIT